MRSFGYDFLTCLLKIEMKMILRNIRLLALTLFVMGSMACSDDPTCTDGEQNQFEMGIDCGGPCIPCVMGQPNGDLPNCADGMMNGEETGIDCGGTFCEPCEGDVEATCDDGIENGEEEGVDCGGPDCDACPTCDDMIQNGDETGVDCGGATCDPC